MKGKVNCIKWITKCIYVDVETGEIIPKHEAYNNYIITHKKKDTYVTATTGTTTITNQCRRKDYKQLTIF